MFESLPCAALGQDTGDAKMNGSDQSLLIVQQADEQKDSNVSVGCSQNSEGGGQCWPGGLREHFSKKLHLNEDLLPQNFPFPSRPSLQPGWSHVSRD